MGDSHAIRIRGLGKRYRLGETRPNAPTLRDALTRFGRRVISGEVFRRREERSFWALDDVSLDVAPGETLGVLGANGAGKSTLLKILSRITAPTTGEVRYRGRLAALLEVGTGFHRELSGRENIYLNGAILGMSRGEIRRRFDEIVAFAGVETFLDTAVKHYSSGMAVRLAFAVAAHLETDVLVVDEVLAVGDAAFQKKCLGKMQDAAQSGRTVLFVSHHAGAVKSLCRSAALLRGGKLVHHGSVDDCFAAYLPQEAAREATFAVATGRTGLQKARVELHGPEARVRLEIAAPRAEAKPHPRLGLHDAAGQPLAVTQPRLDNLAGEAALDAAIAAFECRLDLSGLRSGDYRLSVSLATNTDGKTEHEQALAFSYENPHEPAYLPPPAVSGVVILPARWSSEAASPETAERPDAHALGGFRRAS